MVSRKSVVIYYNDEAILSKLNNVHIYYNSEKMKFAIIYIDEALYDRFIEFLKKNSMVDSIEEIDQNDLIKFEENKKIEKSAK